MKKNDLLKINSLYHLEHGLTDKDVIMCNNYIKFIEKTRNKKMPKTGDILELTDKHGNYYPCAHIQGKGWEDDTLEICENAYVPFIVSTDKELKLSTSGGAWCSVPLKDLKYKGKRKKLFCDWGTCGACAHGAVEFWATVNVWEYKDPAPLFGEYSTKNYKKMHINKLEKPSDYGYMILGEGTAFKNNEEYQAFLKTYKAKVFPSPYYANSEIVFLYKEKAFYITKEKWNNLKNCKIDTRLCNGSIITVKVKYDDKNKLIKVYRYSNHFEKDEQISNERYILARSNKKF